MRNIAYVLLLFLLFSCGKDKVTSRLQKKDKPQLSVATKHTTITFVNSSFVQEIADWKEYKNLTNYIKRFINTSPNEALSNALELQGLVESLRDSVQPKILETSAFKGRINLLHNEILRLSDMRDISIISADEVNAQIDKILNAFSATNSKINTVFRQKYFEEEITIDDRFIGIDTTKMDSTSRKSIEKIKEFQEKNKTLKEKNSKKLIVKQQ